MNFNDFSGGTAGFAGVDFMFEIFPILFGVVFCVVLASFIAVAARGIAQWNRNNRAPVLTVEATVAAKRMHIGRAHHSGADNMAHSAASTAYFVTFEVESGDRMELAVTGEEYGLLIEGDTGRLTFQGTRFKGFDRV